MTTNERVPNMPNDCSGYAFRRCYSVTSARLIKRSNLAMTTNEGEDIPADVQSDSGDDDDDEAEYVKYNAQKLIKQAEFYLNSSMQPGKKPDTAQASEKLYQACTKALMDYAFIIEKRGPAFIHHKRDNPWNYPLFVNFRNVLVRNQKFIGVENATNINDGWNAAYGLHTNGFRMNNLDPIQVKMDLPKVKSFVRTVEELGKMENSELEKEVREIFKERKSIAEKASKIEKEMQSEEFPLAMQTLVHTGNGNRKKLGKKYHQLTNKNLTVEFRKLFEKCFDGYMKDEK